MLAVITCQQANVIYIFILVSQLQAPFIAGKNPFQHKYTFDEKIGCNSFILMMLKVSWIEYILVVGKIWI